MIQLSPEQQQALNRSLSAPLELVNPATDEHYVLLRIEDYQQLQAVTNGATRFALQEMGRRAGWDDPSMDVYDALGQ